VSEDMTGIPNDLEPQDKKHEEESLSAQELHEMAQVGTTLVCTTSLDGCLPRCIEEAHEAVDLDIVG